MGSNNYNVLIGKSNGTTPILWPPDAKMQRAGSFEKTLMLGNMKVGGEGNDRG